jgi:mono/diheme cytochrome c family protein
MKDNRITNRKVSLTGICVLCLTWGFWQACVQGGVSDGQRLYLQHCANCHLEDGRGVGALIPPLAGADYLMTYRDQLPCIVVYGLSDSILVNGIFYAEKMPAAAKLTPVEVANILNYIGKTWGNRMDPFNPQEVQRSLESCR